jgi:hypothetical protein
LPVGDGGLRLDGGAVAGEDVALVPVRRGGVDQLPYPVGERLQGRRLERVHPALAQRVHRDEACAGERLEVFGGLRLPQPGALGQLADRPGPFRQELDDAPPSGVPER